MNLPEMLRHRDVAMRNMNSFAYGQNFGAELAALVEAADEMADDRDTQTDSGAAGRYDDARAALVAKIGGKG